MNLHKHKEKGWGFYPEPKPEKREYFGGTFSEIKTKKEADDRYNRDDTAYRYALQEWESHFIQVVVPEIIKPGDTTIYKGKKYIVIDSLLPFGGSSFVLQLSEHESHGSEEEDIFVKEEECQPFYEGQPCTLSYYVDVKQGS